MLTPAPVFVRLALWLGPRKPAFLLATGLVFACVVVGITYFSTADHPTIPLLLLFPLMLFAGMAFGWFMWELFIWPTLAAYPGSPELPPHARVYRDDERTSVAKQNGTDSDA